MRAMCSMIEWQAKNKKTADKGGTDFREGAEGKSEDQKQKKEVKQEQEQKKEE